MPDRTDHERLFQEALDRLPGKRCWGVVAGKGTGTIFTLDFGAMFPRASPVRNPHLSRAVRENEAELSLMAHCAWRIDGPGEVLTGCWESNEADGPMLRGLNALLERTVTATRFTRPGLDLELEFSGGHHLRLFCDQTDPEETFQNYSLHTSTWISVVGCRSELSTHYLGPSALP
jgi:hypothetical protein